MRFRRLARARAARERCEPLVRGPFGGTPDTARPAAVQRANGYAWGMALASTLLASGTDWQVSEVLCTSGPRDRSHVEPHSRVSIARVTAGSFHYRTSQGEAIRGALSLARAAPNAN